MKILQIINTLAARGAEKLVVDSVIEYHKRGLRVDILLLSDSTSPYRQNLEKYPNIEIFAVGKNINVYNPLIIFRLTRYFRGYDIVHAHLFPTLYWVGIANILSPSRRYMLYTEHSTDNKRRKNKVFRLADRLIYKQFDKVVAISPLAASRLQKHLGPSFKNIRTINNGINLKIIQNARAYPKSKLGLEENTFLLIQVASFRYPKNQKTVIRALSYLEKNVHLLLIGNGPLLQENIELSEKLRVSERVHFLGIRNDVPNLLKTADTVILSSYYEGLSLSSIEGMASGKPFIASDSPGLSDTVNNSDALFPPDDEVKLKNLITKLKDDSAFYADISKEGIKRSKKFDINTMLNEYIKIYHGFQVQ